MFQKADRFNTGRKWFQSYLKKRKRKWIYKKGYLDCTSEYRSCR